ncbi:TetR/AcrR family transcriptional regulator [Streptodolium elevatio]|uniref:TetR/AcrR family transcriptional regulator n=1 Tax=Streptodolium elevatio TaxID=3157996 RepID=A0ABV3DQK9_9ACTN
MPKVAQAHLDARRRQIVEAAGRCFARNGFHRTSMQDVFAESGLSAGAVYRYFAGKDELIADIAAGAVGQVRASVRALLDSGRDLSPADTLARLIDDLGAFRDPDGTGRLMIHAWGESLGDPALREVIAALNREMLDELAEVADGFVGAGHLPADADRRAVAHTLLSLMQGYVVQFHVTGDLTPERYLVGLRDLLG